MSDNAQNLALSGEDFSPIPTGEKSVIGKLLPIIGVIFIAYLIIGLAMSVLPLYVHDKLGFSTFVGGLVAGSQFIAALFSRPVVGHYADRNGAKRAVVCGLSVAVISGIFYLVSLWFIANPLTSVVILILGRIALGIAESFIITGALSWGITPPELKTRVKQCRGSELRFMPLMRSAHRWECGLMPKKDLLQSL